MIDLMNLSEDQINVMIKANKIDTNLINDGYHNFGELYEARIVLYIAICRQLSDNSAHIIWRSKKHSDGSEWEGWFLLGIDIAKGSQITYHLPMSKWDETHFVDDTYDQAPEFDGHTSADVLERLKTL
jgi:hypothetical protein